MPQQMLVEKLHRLTLVRKGRAVAKHPDMRDGVLEVVKSEDAVLRSDDLDTSSYDWYEDFADFILNCDPSITASVDEGASTWEGEFAAYARSDAYLKESASGKKKNYPDGAGPFAGPHNSFPISSQHHVYAAARLLGHASNKAQVKANIIRIAHEKGYSLPKSWQKKTTKAEEEGLALREDTPLKPEMVDKALATVRAYLLGEQEDLILPTATPPESVEIPAEAAALLDPEAAPPSAEEVEEVDKAKAPPHAHNHSHVTTYGYSYSHEHPHGDGSHADADDHASSETLHAHEHVAKSGDLETDGLRADVAGLAHDLQAAHAEVETLKAELATLQEAKATAEAKQSSAEVKAQELYKHLLRRPLTAPTQGVEKSAAVITNETPWDEAFAIALGR